MPLQIVRNDITKMKVDAIVNAATSRCWVAAVWTAAFIVPLDRSCWQNMKRSMAAALRNRNYLVLESAVWYYMLVLFTMGEIICSLRWMRSR